MAAQSPVRRFRRRPTVALETSAGRRGSADHPELDRLTSAMVESRSASAVHALIGDARAVLVESLAAAPGGVPRAGLDRGSLFDLASLTKPWMASLAVVLAANDEAPMALALGEIWPRVSPELRPVTLGEMLRHRGGFRAWAPLYGLCQRRGEVARALLDGSLRSGGVPVYSDLDYILWGESVKRLTGEDLDRLLARRVLEPLGLRRVDRQGVADRSVPCRLDGSREQELARAQGLSLRPPAQPRAGEPHDGNARFLGGLAGHAGLFATGAAVWALGRLWLRPSLLLGDEGIATALAGPGRFAAGWWRRRVRGSAGPHLSPAAFGHTGFTGGSLWIEPKLDRVGVLLAHRTGLEADLMPWRRRFHRLMARL